jgi:hypothetical protein
MNDARNRSLDGMGMKRSITIAVVAVALILLAVGGWTVAAARRIV